jgi:hypothetical protein
MKTLPFSIGVRLVTEIGSAVLFLACLVETAVRGAIWFVFWGTNVVMFDETAKKHLHKLSGDWLEGTLHSLVNSISHLFLLTVNPVTTEKPGKIISKMVSKVVVPSLDWSMTSLMLMNDNTNKAFSYNQLPKNPSTDFRLKDVSNHYQQLVFNSIKLRDYFAEKCSCSNPIAKVGTFIGRLAFEGYLALIAAVAIVELVGRAIIAGIVYALSHIMPTKDQRDSFGDFAKDQFIKVSKIFNFLKIQLIVLGSNPFEEQMLYKGFSKEDAEGPGYIDSRFYNALKECPYSNQRTQFTRFLKAHVEKFIANADIADLFNVLKEALLQLDDLSAAMDTMGGKPVFEAITPMINALAEAQDDINSSAEGKKALKTLLEAALGSQGPYQPGALNTGIEQLLQVNTFLGDNLELGRLIRGAAKEFKDLAVKDPQLAEKLLTIIPQLQRTFTTAKELDLEALTALFRTIRDQLGEIESLDNLLHMAVRILGGEEKMFSLVKKLVHLVSISADPKAKKGKELLEELGGEEQILEFFAIATKVFGSEKGIIDTCERAIQEVGYSEEVLDFIDGAVPLIRGAIEQLSAVPEGETPLRANERRIGICLELVGRLGAICQGPNQLLTLFNKAVTILGGETETFALIKRFIQTVGTLSDPKIAKSRELKVLIQELGGERKVIEAIEQLADLFGGEKEVIGLVRLGARTAGHTPGFIPFLRQALPLFAQTADALKQAADRPTPEEKRAHQVDCTLDLVHGLIALLDSKEISGEKRSLLLLKQLLEAIQISEEEGTKKAKEVIVSLGGAQRLSALIDQISNLFGGEAKLITTLSMGARSFAHNPAALEFIQKALPLLSETADLYKARDEEHTSATRDRRIEATLNLVHRLTEDGQILELFDIAVHVLGGEKEVMALLRRLIATIHVSQDPLAQKAKEVISDLGGPDQVNAMLDSFAAIYGDDAALVETVRQGIAEIGQASPVLSFLSETLPFLAATTEELARAPEGEVSGITRGRRIDVSLQILQRLVSDPRCVPTLDTTLKILGGDKKAMALLKQVVKTVSSYQGPQAQKARAAIQRLGGPKKVNSLIDQICLLIGGEEEIVATAKRGIRQLQSSSNTIEFLRKSLPLILATLEQISIEVEGELPQAAKSRQIESGLKLLQNLMTQFDGPEPIIELLDTVVATFDGPVKAITFFKNLINALGQSDAPQATIIRDLGGSGTLIEQIERLSTGCGGDAAMLEALKAKLRQVQQAPQLMSFLKTALPAMAAAAVSVVGEEPGEVSTPQATQRREIDAGIAMLEQLFATMRPDEIEGLFDQTITLLGKEEGAIARLKELIQTVATSKANDPQAIKARERIAQLGGPDNIIQMIKELSELLGGDRDLIDILRTAIHEIVTSSDMMDFLMKSLRPIAETSLQISEEVPGETHLMKKQRQTVAIVNLVQRLLTQFQGPDRLISVLNTFITTFGGEEKTLVLLKKVLSSVSTSKIAQAAEAKEVLKSLGGADKINQMIGKLSKFFKGDKALIETLRKALHAVGSSPEMMDFLERGLPLILEAADKIAYVVVEENPQATQKRQVEASLDLVLALVTEFGGPQRFLGILDMTIGVVGGERPAFELMKMMIEANWNGTKKQWLDFERVLGTFGEPEQFFDFVRSCVSIFGSNAEKTIPVVKQIAPIILQTVAKTKAKQAAGSSAAAEAAAATPPIDVDAVFDFVEELLVESKGPGPLLELFDTALHAYKTPDELFIQLRQFINLFSKDAKKVAALEAFDRLFGKDGIPPTEAIHLCQNLIRAIGKDEATLHYLRNLSKNVVTTCQGKEEIGFEECFAILEGVVKSQGTVATLDRVIEALGGPKATVALIKRLVGLFVPRPEEAMPQFDNIMLIIGSEEEALRIVKAAIAKFGTTPEKIPVIQGIMRDLLRDIKEKRFSIETLTSKLGSKIGLFKDLIELLGGHDSTIELLERAKLYYPKHQMAIGLLQGYITLLKGEARLQAAGKRAADAVRGEARKAAQRVVEFQGRAKAWWQGKRDTKPATPAE